MSYALCSNMKVSNNILLKEFIETRKLIEQHQKSTDLRFERLQNDIVKLQHEIVEIKAETAEIPKIKAILLGEDFKGGLVGAYNRIEASQKYLWITLTVLGTILGGAATLLVSIL